LDTRQTHYFIGLSTPACTIFVLGLVLAAQSDRFGVSDLIHQQWLLYLLVGILAWLLNSPIPMFGLKIRRFDLRSNALLFVFLGIFGLLVFKLKELALSATILIYIFASILLKNKVVGTA
jgi:CDP-diacylglycerol--serine O-phosphatidyltransferase